MSKTSVTKITVTVTGDGIESTYTPDSIINASSAPGGGGTNVAYTSGDNTLTVPTGAVGLLLVPASTSSNVKRLKEDAGDTGWRISPSKPTFLALDASASAYILSLAAGETVFTQWV